MNNIKKESWLELYKVADEIHDIAPWHELADNNTLFYIDEETKQPIYFCIMGNAGIHRGIGVYRGSEGVGLFETMEESYPFPIMVNYQSCLKVNYISIDETMEENIKLLDELNIKYEGDITSFEIYKKGCAPKEFYTSSQVTEMTRHLKVLLQALKEIAKMPNIDYDTFCGLITTNEDGSLSIIKGIPSILKEEARPINIERAKLTKLKQLPIKSSLEYELEFNNYLPVMINDMIDENGICHYPRIRMLAEKKHGLIYDMNLDNPLKKSQEEYYADVIAKLVQIFTKSGLPSKLYVRDNESKSLLKEIEDNTDIQIIVNHQLPNIDEALENLPFFK